MNRRMEPRATVGVVLLLFIIGVVAACTTGATTSQNPNAPPSNNGNGGFVPQPTLAPYGGGQPAGSTGNNIASNPGGGLPNLQNKPQPQEISYQGCPGQGDGGDPGLNNRKNRVDTAAWYPVTIGSILNLQWPKSIERKQRSTWSASDQAAIAQYEGIPVQIEGWLAGAKQEGPESCNCHAPDDVDNHLWIVDAPNKDRSQSMVIEITPRMRAQNPGWAFNRIQPLVDGATKVRISGWLLMDQEHPDQVGKTRGTIWEIHPIVAFDFQRGNQWLSLNTGRVSTTAANAGNPGASRQIAPPTEDPSLPPAIVETPGPGARITPVPRTTRGTSQGTGTGTGPVQITDIAYRGTGTSQADEYVEITNSSSTPINMAGWVLHDVYGGQEFTWPTFNIRPGLPIRVYTNQVHPDWGGFSFQSKEAIWNNSGDAAELLDAQGNVVSTYAYGNRR